VQYRIVLKYLTGRKSGSSEVFPLPRAVSELKIGRDPVCDIRFDAHLDTAVSRHHASLQWIDERMEEVDAEQNPRWQRRFELVDLISSNGTFVNGKRIEHASPLVNGDEVQFGGNGPLVRIEMQDDVIQASGFTPRTETIPAVQFPDAKPVSSEPNVVPKQNK
jgi:pSer/pThr/pTyr-binding forkhead associated (FHA) protein